MDLMIYREPEAPYGREPFELLGIVDTASSVIWTDRFRQCGDFEIDIPASAASLELLQIDHFAVRPGHDMAGIIEKVEITTDEENGDHIIATGRCLRSILDRRIVSGNTQINNSTVETALRYLVDRAYINSWFPDKEDPRRYTKLRLGEIHNYPERMTAQYTGSNLLEVIEELCATFNYGFRIKMLDVSTLEVDFYKAADRSAGQSDLPRVIFSDKSETLISSSYIRDKKAFKNFCIVAGEGEGSERKQVTTYLDNENIPTGLQLREMFVDARDLSSSTDDGTLTDDEYAAVLIARGEAKMREAAEIASMTGSVETSNTYAFGKDYFLGDMVTVENKYGIQTTAQVLEVVETWDANGYSCTPTFG